MESAPSLLPSAGEQTTILIIMQYNKNIQFSTIAIIILCCHNVQAITILCSIPSPPKVHCNPHQHHHMCISVSSLEATKCPKAFERQRQEAPVLREATQNMPSLSLPLTLHRLFPKCDYMHCFAQCCDYCIKTYKSFICKVHDAYLLS